MTGDRRQIEAAGLAASLGTATVLSGLTAMTASRSRHWYRGLDRPTAVAPAGVVVSAAALLYASQAVAGWLVWRGDARRAEYDVPAMTAYGVQLGLSAVWTLLFFGLRRPALALAEACVLWLAVMVTVREFGRRHRFAATLLLPTAVYATYLVAANAGLWWRNR